MTLIDRLKSHASERPDALAMAFLPRGAAPVELTWSSLLAHVRGQARALAERGVQAGDALAIVSGSPQEQALSFLGAVWLGAEPTILSHPSSKVAAQRFTGIVRTVLQSSRARFLLHAGAYVELAAEWIAGTDARAVELKSTPPADEAPPCTGEGAFLQYSSGTTGARKGVRITRAMLEEQAASYLRVLDVRPQDRIVSWLPLYHDMGLVACFLLPLHSGLASVHIPTFDWVQQPAKLFEAIARYRGSLVWLPNFALSFLVSRTPTPAQCDLSSLRALVNCSEPVRPATMSAFARHFSAAGLRPEVLTACYAMAEATFAVTQTTPGVFRRVDRVRRSDFLQAHRAVRAAEAEADALEFESCGAPIPGVEVRVEGDAERSVAEVLIRGPSVFGGYERGGALDREAIDAEGWFHTGDLGYLADGELFVTGRKKDLIIHRGTNLYPHDLEEAAGAVPGCKAGRAVVFGIDSPDGATELIVVLAEPDGTVADEEQVRAGIRTELAAQFGVTPSDVQLRPAGTLLKSTSGKLSRSANRAAYLESIGRPH